MLSNFDIEEICQQYGVPLVGVFMKDELPSQLCDGNYIINLQSSTEGNGTHWTALVIDKTNAFFMDSFGAYPSQDIVKFVRKRKGLHLGYNNWIIQNIDSNFCGYFCIALFIYLRLNPGKLFHNANMFVSGFNDNSKSNDAVLKSFFLQNTKGKLTRLVQRLIRLK